MNNKIQLIEKQEIFTPEKLFHEINLLRIEGYYFCLDPKSSSKNTDTISFLEKIKTPEGFIQKPITIDPNPKYGKPSILAYKILNTIIKKYSDYYRPYPKGVPFTQRELAKLVGRKKFGGSDQKKFHQAIMQLRRTGIVCSFYNKEKKEWGAIDFQILDDVLLSGKQEVINQCYFCLNPIIVKSLNNQHSFCLNYSRMEILEPIGTSLFKHLFFHFSNIYSKGKNKDLSFTKDYKTICKTWLGGLKPEKYKSKILSNQLGKHFEKLKQTGIIKKIEIEKNVKKDGFNITFYPGNGFFEDYKTFYITDNQLKLDFKKATEENLIKKPLELVHYFYKNLLQVDNLENMVFEDSDVNLAQSFLNEYSFEVIQKWIDYSIEKAKKDKFEMKRFGGIKNFKIEYFGKFKKAEEKREVNIKKQQQIKTDENLKEQYQKYKDQITSQYLNQLDPTDYQKKFNTAKNRLQEQQPNIFKFTTPKSYIYTKLVEEEMTEELIKQKKLKIEDFESWKKISKQ